MHSRGGGLQCIPHGVVKIAQIMGFVELCHTLDLHSNNFRFGKRWGLIQPGELPGRRSHTRKSFQSGFEIGSLGLVRMHVKENWLPENLWWSPYSRL